MPVLTSDAVILRTWPLREADLIVSFFARDYGRMRGVAKAALKSRKRFGGALEPMTVVRAWFAEKPRTELVRLDQLEILRSPLSSPVDAVRLAALSFYAEVLDEALPEHDPQDAVFRLVVSVLEQTAAVAAGTEVGVPLVPALGRGRPDRPHADRPRATQPQSSGPQPSGPRSSGSWMALSYFSLWMTRLMGLLPDIAHCIVCGEALHAADLNPDRNAAADAADLVAGAEVLKGHGFSRAASREGRSGALAPEGNSFPAEKTHSHDSGIFFTPHADGLFCALHRNGSANSLSADSWQLAQRMLRAPVSAFAAEPWTRRRAQDLRRFTLETLERHLEKKLRTAEALARLGG